jgi:hypothetical protein
MFYVVAIFLVMVTPLAVPVTVTILHAINNWTQNVAAARPTTSSVTAPARRRAAPAAA